MRVFWREYQSWLRCSRWSDARFQTVPAKLLYCEGNGLWREPTDVEWQMVRAFNTIDAILNKALCDLAVLGADTRYRIERIEG